MTVENAITWCKENAQKTYFTGEMQYAFLDTVGYLKELSQLREEKRATGFENAYDRGYEVGRLKGQEEAWDAAKKIMLKEADGGLSVNDLVEMFGKDYSVQGRNVIFKKYTAAEAIKRINEWEESKVIHVGDVVKHKTKDLCGAILVKTDSYYSVVWQDGSIMGYSIDDDTFTKTGRTVDVAKFLKQIEGGDDE